MGEKNTLRSLFPIAQTSPRLSLVKSTGSLNGNPLTCSLRSERGD